MAADISTTAGDGRPANARKRTETVTPLIEPFKCSDGKWVQFSMPIGNAWDRFCAAIGRPDFVEHEQYGTPTGRFQNNIVLMGELDRIFSTKTRDDWAPILDEHRLTWAPINNTAEVLADPAVRATGAFEQIEHPLAGSFDTVASPFRMHTAESKVRGPAPNTGEHTNEVLTAIGLDGDAIAQLVSDRVVS
jgi:crotonobetainyl-CoA:carnitine CoA-transferase CaiB-like acyl-CoA transferase